MTRNCQLRRFESASRDRWRERCLEFQCVGSDAGAIEVKLKQEIDVTLEDEKIDAGQVEFTFSAWLKTNPDTADTDTAQVIVEYLNENGDVLGNRSHVGQERGGRLVLKVGLDRGAEEFKCTAGLLAAGFDDRQHALDETAAAFALRAEQ